MRLLGFILVGEEGVGLLGFILVGEVGLLGFILVGEVGLLIHTGRRGGAIDSYW